ncbi:MAG: hypothetical protein HY744_09355 [Deltaproteobacteria bacterium]|nr:hypothetical protein [Deltaproteobacteria bacterium]
MSRRLALLFISALALCGCGENRTAAPRDPYTGPEPLACVPNLDGRIDSAEIQAAIDVTVTYLVSPSGTERPVDVAGKDAGEGRRSWDWSTDFADDQIARVTPRRLGAQWYVQSFPAGQFVTAADAAGRIESIFRQDGEALWLLGLASREEDPPEGKTLLVYQQPVAALRFPVAPGTSYVSTGVVENGTALGLPYAGKDVYEVTADALGELVLPQIEFGEVHRVRTHAALEPAVGKSTTRRQVSFFAECFAEVARAVGRDGEKQADFTTAAELWRLGFEETDGG